MKQRIFTGIFLALEAVLYYLILTAGGKVLVASCFLSILLCACFALVNWGDKCIIAGLACTVMADLFLVVWQPQQQLWGMVWFLCAQSLYAVKLQRMKHSKALGIVRIALTGIGALVTVVVLQEKTDALAVISVCYYANLIMNIVQSMANFRKVPLLAIGFVLFLLCDTVIGLQVAAGGYLPISEGSLLYRIIFMDFFLSWFFYLPSQVLIALSSLQNEQIRPKGVSS